MRKPRGSARDRPADFGPGPPPREAPQEPWEGAQAARERPPGTHARGILVYIIQYTVYIIQYTNIIYCILCKVYIIQYTVCSVQCTV